MYVIGTAGHVDHGKSALVQALTGIDPDRLAEEKRRGLTIDLGFAWLGLPSGREVGIIDVPGHERFIKNMLAGVGAINVTLFVVAANEGWKPQSQEHLDILDLLGVSAAVIAITKSDTVDKEKLQGVVEDVSRRMAGTTLRNAPVHVVSAMTGDGLQALIDSISELLHAAPPAPDRGRPRLWIDRVFSMHGSGTVVTGTLIDGTLHQNQEIEILPQGLRARIRSIQSHRKTVTEIGPGNRTALNLVGLETAVLERGDAVVVPGSWMITRQVGTTIRFLPQLDHEPTERGAFKFYIGSAERDARLRLVGGFALLQLDDAVVVDWGDRFVLRDAGRRETLGGGIVVEPQGAELRGPTDVIERRLHARSRDGRAHYAAVLLEEHEFIPRNQIFVRTGLDQEAARTSFPAVWTLNFALHEEFFGRVEGMLIASIKHHHQEHPLDAGLPLSAARVEAGLEARVFDDLLEELVRRQHVVIADGALKLPGFAPEVGGEDHDRLIDLLEKEGASPPTVSDLRGMFDSELLKSVVRRGEAVQVSPDLIFSTKWFESIKRAIRERAGREGPFTVAEFRDLAGTTRKYAVPLLEYLDREGFTKRRGDQRELGPKA